MKKVNYADMRFISLRVTSPVFCTGMKLHAGMSFMFLSSKDPLSNVFLKISICEIYDYLLFNICVQKMNSLVFLT